MLNRKILTTLLIGGLTVAAGADAQPCDGSRGGQMGQGCMQGQMGHHGRGHRGGCMGRHGKMGRRGGQMRPGAAKLMRLFRGMDLTEAQDIALLKARRSLRQSQMPKAELQAANQKTLVEQLKSGAPDKSVLYGLVDARAARKTARERAQVDAFLSVYATLTPAQKQLVAQRAELAQQRGAQQQQMGRGRGRRNLSPVPDMNP